MYSIWVDVWRLCSGTAFFCEGKVQASLGVGVPTALEPAPSGEWGITTALALGVIWSSLELLYEFTLCIETVCFSLCDVHALCLCCQHPPVRHVLNILHPSRLHSLSLVTGHLSVFLPLPAFILALFLRVQLVGVLKWFFLCVLTLPCPFSISCSIRVVGCEFMLES